MAAWEGIEEAVMVAQMGSFVRAAQRLNTAPSNVSRAIDRLEQRLKTRLFTRTTRVVKLTDSGRLLITRFARLVAERDEAFATLDSGGEPHGDLRITCSAAMGERFVAPIMRELCRKHPQLSIHLNLTNRVVDLVGEGYDLAIRTGDLTDSRLICTQIAQRRVLTCASPAYLAQHGTPAKVGDLAQHACLVGTSDEWRFRQNGETVLWRAQGRWHCNNGHAIVAAAREDMGICHLPEFYVSEDIKNGRLAVILDQFRQADESIWAVYPSRRHLSARVQVAIEALRQAMPSVI
ncbi:LysR family transcriptional regulator [Novosphingobium umbonatum]|uniref:LysR family transcriptional regulator n=1 Tax=Novosphingobium umbonatum TaxID=1908524 RepID=A0A3S2VTW9_9SPHN|nr:LysR family transcriptional regulator [Novosphingobium umbonatum]RVU05686.1 LysR family transcriptional regulator [Novosphingobium umbonatum]